MKLTTTLHLALALAAGMFTTSVIAGPGPRIWPPAMPTHVTTKMQAMKCCLPDAKVALACKDCKTINEKDGANKKGIMAWFAPDSKHDCSGCGGKITVKQVGGGKGPTISEYTHTCSKCGDKSAYVCTDHKKA